MSAIIGLLKPQQRLIADEFSQILVYESSHSDLPNSSDDGQGEVQDKAKEWALKNIIKSRDMVDRRLVDLIRVQQASLIGL